MKSDFVRMAGQGLVWQWPAILRRLMSKNHGVDREKRFVFTLQKSISRNVRKIIIVLLLYM